MKPTLIAIASLVVIGAVALVLMLSRTTDPATPRTPPPRAATPVAPTEARQRRAAVAARGEVETAARVEQQAGELGVVPVAGLVQLRPAVVVVAIRVGAALEQEPDELEVAGHPE